MYLCWLLVITDVDFVGGVSEDHQFIEQALFATLGMVISQFCVRSTASEMRVSIFHGLS